MTNEKADRLGFLGGGQMASALAKGAVLGDLYLSKQLVFCEPSNQQQQKLVAEFPGCSIATNASELFGLSSKIVIAVKPQILKEISSQIRSLVHGEHLLVSIAAGITLPQLAEYFGSHRIVRVMPNTPAQVMAGASGIAFGRETTEIDREWATRLLRGVGMVVNVSDAQLHAVTGLSGSGPAYVLLMIEALSDGGVAAGLARDVATQLAVQTVLGTAKMVAETGLHPAVLRDQVTSPGGTTIAALQVLENRGVRSAFIDAVKAATDRSRELAS
jgi:pyrroline-5-carboxylate reductase